MRHLLPTLFIVSSLLIVVQGQQAPACRDSQECRQFALDAESRAEYEAFHDLAWRAVQTGPRNDAALMYLLARAQVLSGRPHDALVMLQRLAEMGVATDAATNADFKRTRELPGWPEVAPAIARVGTTTLEPAPSRSAAARGASAPSPGARGRGASAAPASPPGRTPSGAAVAVRSAAVPFPLEPAITSDAGTFSTGQFLAAGLAYDAVSRRFVIGDALARKLIVVGVGSDHADDLVRADSAGFDDVAAVAIDELRGNLWVASTSDASGESALHRLQLVSGRALKSYRATPAIGRTRLIDLAVLASGEVVALDSSGNRLVTLASGGSEMTVAMSLKLSGSKSVTAGDAGVLYVAHDGGIARIDVRSGTVTALAAPRGFDLRGFDSIRAHHNALIGLQTTPAGLQQLVRLTLNSSGRAVSEGSVIDPRAGEMDGRASLTITGNELYYLAANAANAGPAPSTTGSIPASQFVVRRLTLR